VRARFIGRTGVRLAASLAVSAAAATAGIAPARAATASVPTYYLGDNCGISSSDYWGGANCGGLLLFYHANGDGATASITGDATNLSHDPIYSYSGPSPVLKYYADYVFWGAAYANNDGEGQGIRNNVGSVSNQTNLNTYTLYVYPGYSGASQTFGPHSYYANLNSQLRNNEASVLES